MSEELNPKELPHELLMRRYNLSIEQMGTHTKQLKTDLDRTLRLVLNKSTNGAVKLTPTTQSKIETYDRYICDGIFEYLENQEQISSEKANVLEKQADEKRDEVKDKMEDLHNEANEGENISNEPKGDTQETPPNKDEGVARIGFWTWE